MGGGSAIIQTILRVLAIVLALASIGFMLTSSQTTHILGFSMEAKYTFTPSFRFLVIMNAAACLFTLLILIFTFIPTRRPGKYFFIVVIDLITTVCAVAGCSAAAAIGDLGSNGNSHTGWMPICDHFDIFCSKVRTSILLSVVTAALFLILTIWSAFLLTKL